MGAKLPQPAPDRRPDGSVDPAYIKPPASPAPPPPLRGRCLFDDLATRDRAILNGCPCPTCRRSRPRGVIRA